MSARGGATLGMEGMGGWGGGKWPVGGIARTLHKFLRLSSSKVEFCKVVMLASARTHALSRVATSTTAVPPLEWNATVTELARCSRSTRPARG